MTKFYCFLFILSSLFVFSCGSNSSSVQEEAIKVKKDSVTAVIQEADAKKKNLRVLSLGTIDSGGRTNYTIATPAGWTKKTDTIIKGGRFVILTSSTDLSSTKFHENINVISETLLKPGLDNYLKSGKAGMLRNMPGVIFTGEGDTVINKHAAKWMTAIFAGTKMVTYRALIYLLVEDKFGYCITCMSTDPGFEQYDKVFKETVGSFRLVDQK